MAASMKYMSRPALASCDDVILANFKNGRLQVSETGNCSNAPNFTFSKSVDTDDNRRKHWRTLVAEAQGMQYVGQNYGSQAPKANTACKYLVGVLDKKSNKMKVYDAQYYQLQPWLRTNGDKEGQDETDQEKSTEKSYAEKQDALTEAFGSKRKRRAVDSRHKSRIGSEALEKSAKTAVTIAKSQPTTPIKETMDSEGVIPPCDRNATDVKDVYKLEDILSTHLQKSLQKPAKKFCSASFQELQEWQQKKTYSQFILDHVRGLANDPSETEKKQQSAVILLFIHYLSMMHGLKVSELKKIPYEEDTPPVVKKHLLESFTQSTLVGDGNREKRCLPKRMKDKILSHALVLALILDDYKTSLSSLQSTMKVGIRSMESHARALGCRLSLEPSKESAGKGTPTPSSTGTSAQRIAALSLPLRISHTPKKKLGGKKR